MLYLALLRNLGGIQLVLLDAAGKPMQDAFGQTLGTMQLKPEKVQPVGFAEDEALNPYPLNTFRGYRYLQEYFAFQDKFLFVDLKGLDGLKRLPPELLERARGMELRFDIRKAGVQRIRPMNVTWVKIQVDWSFVQPDAPTGEPGVTFRRLELYIERLKRNNFSTILSIAKAPAWARPGRTGGSSRP